MATILLAAAGAAVGAGFGGTVLGLSGAVIGRAIGATVGRAIDQRILGGGSDPVEVGRMDRLQLMGANEGAGIARTWGRMRLPGHVIWASPYTEITREVGGGGKGAPRSGAIQYSYTVSLAMALCEGEIMGIGRIWADAREIDPASLDLRLYTGTATQTPDPTITAYEGAGQVPAYRGTAYVVLENLALEPFGNRVPQFSFEVLRKAQPADAEGAETFQDLIRGVAIIPGTGEYALATEKVRRRQMFGQQETLNAHTPGDAPDLTVSLRQLRDELPSCTAASLVISWFGNDLRCGNCTVRPKVAFDPAGDPPSMEWRAGGIGLGGVQQVPQSGGRSVYGGTPADHSVLQAIAALKADGKEVMFYPFVLMDQLAGNGLADPYSDAADQPVLPWRGRITLAKAPGRAGSSDGTLAARAEVSAFFGAAEPGHFQISGQRVLYSGPEDWGYRRFILHYAHLCVVAGGVESFCIGSELRGLTGIMAEGTSFPAVDELRALAEDVRQILGPNVKIGYAADWSEYFGHHRGADVYFNLDPLWSHPDVDFIGIDNYMPISDWRDAETHADAGWGTIYNMAYLQSGVAGGEGYDWYYDGPEGQAAQLRKPISDDEYDEPWVYRYKDILGWWSHAHHNRVGGVRSAVSTGWVPGAKPVRFTEYGCAAIDKGTNEPNKFLDPKSSESALPRYSSGERDDYLQLQYFRAMYAHWRDAANNPEATAYAGRMVDMDHAYAWAWDSRPFPEFPRNETLWADGPNWRTGHWLNGRNLNQPLDAIVREICEGSDVAGSVTAALHGAVPGFALQDSTTARAGLQPLSMAYGFDALEAGGALAFLSRGLGGAIEIDADWLAQDESGESSLQKTRLPEADAIGRVRLGYVSDAGAHTVRVVEAQEAGQESRSVSQTEFTGTLTDSFARAVVQRWLVENKAGRDLLSLRLPPSRLEVGAGSVLKFGQGHYRVDRIEVGADRLVEAVRIEGSAYAYRDFRSEVPAWQGHRAASPVSAVWLDIPSPLGNSVAPEPYLGVVARPWPGQVGLWTGSNDANYRLDLTLDVSASIGVLQDDLPASRLGLFDLHRSCRVTMVAGSLTSVDAGDVLGGANLAAIGDGSKDNWEIVQFTSAVLVAPDTYELSGFLRGQNGTDGFMPNLWPAGSFLVLLDNRLPQISLAETLRNVERDYRIGATAKGPSDVDSSFHRLAFAGNGSRPYPVCHLRSHRQPGGDVTLSWIRRTRVGGDAWEGLDVPLGEETESYRVAIFNGAGGQVRETVVNLPGFSYPMTLQSQDGISGTFRIEVAQISASYGPGPVRSIQIT